MDKAKAAVAQFTARAGHHHTTVDETVTPHVVSEVVKPTRHEEVQQAIDREVHQDHYHTTVQPLQHREVVPEKHVHQMGAVQERSFEHDDKEATRAKIEQVSAQFKDTSIQHDVKHTVGAAPTVEAEHVHHHVHEIVQPVIHKETIVPEVIHTTVPIHEIHHAAVQHHGTSVLPTKSLTEFLESGGALKGGKITHGEYDGCPRPYNSEMQLEHTPADDNPHSAGAGADHVHGSHVHGSKNRSSSSSSSSSDENRRTTKDGASSGGVGFNPAHSKHSTIGKGVTGNTQGNPVGTSSDESDGRRGTIGASGMDEIPPNSNRLG